MTCQGLKVPLHHAVSSQGETVKSYIKKKKKTEGRHGSCIWKCSFDKNRYCECVLQWAEVNEFQTDNVIPWEMSLDE